MIGKKLLTYFTPSYNRAHTLPRLYESLCNQTNKDFIWLVIDDGSKDDTRELVEGWIKENKIEIQYHLKENGGKHTAINLSNELCETKYINCIDSDDFLTDNCTEVILKYIDEVDKDDNVCGIVSRRADYSGIPNSLNWPQTNSYIYFNDLYEKMGYVGETSLVFKTEIIKKFKFPVFENERFVTESVFYNQFMFDYKMFAVCDCVYIGEYQADGYTLMGKKLFFKNPKGYMYTLKQNLYYDRKRRINFLKQINRTAVYYATKKVLKQKEIEDFKIPYLYNILGKLFASMHLKRISNEYRLFDENKER